MAPIAYESRGALCHALIVVNHKPLVVTCFSGRDYGAELLGHTAPALKAPQALRMATLILVCAGSLAT